MVFIIQTYRFFQDKPTCKYTYSNMVWRKLIGLIKNCLQFFVYFFFIIIALIFIKNEADFKVLIVYFIFAVQLIDAFLWLKFCLAINLYFLIRAKLWHTTLLWYNKQWGVSKWILYLLVKIIYERDRYFLNMTESWGSVTVCSYQIAFVVDVADWWFTTVTTSLKFKKSQRFFNRNMKNIVDMTSTLNRL